MKTVHSSHLAARQYMAYLLANGVQFSYSQRNACEHIVTVL